MYSSRDTTGSSDLSCSSVVTKEAYIQTYFVQKQHNMDSKLRCTCYYLQVGKYEEICEIGQDVEILRKNGILVDAEADPGDFDSEQTPELR